MTTCHVGLPGTEYDVETARAARPYQLIPLTLHAREPERTRDALLECIRDAFNCLGVDHYTLIVRTSAFLDHAQLNARGAHVHAPSERNAG